MAFFNYVTKEITLKVVYYGPGLSGKTTNLQHLYSLLDSSARGKFISLSTESDRTLFFDFLPVELGKIKDFSVRFQLYTVPGQIRYNATRKLVLKGADAVVFVADSQRDMREQNVESFVNMRENLASNNLDPDDIPIVFQYNKRDLPNLLSREELDADLKRGDFERIEAVARNGVGVQETFRLVTKLLLRDMARKHKVDIAPPKEEGVTVRLPEKERFEIEEEVAEMPAPKDIFPEKMPQETVPQTGPVGLAVSQRQAPENAPSPAARIRPRTVPYSDERLTPVMNGLRDVSQSLSGIRETLSVLYTELKESGRQQTEMLKMLREIGAALSAKTRKRRWFHFFS